MVLSQNFKRKVESPLLSVIASTGMENMITWSFFGAPPWRAQRRGCQRPFLGNINAEDVIDLSYEHFIIAYKGVVSLVCQTLR
jgi:hypothetical protein